MPESSRRLADLSARLSGEFGPSDDITAVRARAISGVAGYGNSAKFFSDRMFSSAAVGYGLG